MITIFSGGVKFWILDNIPFDKKEEKFSISRSSCTDAFCILASIYLNFKYQSSILDGRMNITFFVLMEKKIIPTSVVDIFSF